MLKHSSLRRQKGLSIIEMMVGVAIALIVLAGAAALYLNTTRGGLASQRQVRLTQEVRAVMDIMIQDIRRSGYWASAINLGTNPFMVRTGANQTDLYVNNNCILYAYDATFITGNTAGSVDSRDFFGFRRNGAAMQMLPVNSGLENTATAAAGCGALTWNDITDSAAVTITGMTSSVDYKCLSLAGTETTGTTPCTTSADIETRQVNLSITAQHADDATITITIADSVLLPNNRLVP